MRIAVITTSYPRDESDASGHFVRAEVRQLERAGAHVHVFAARGAAFGWPGVAARIKERPARAMGVPLSLMRLARALRDAGPFDRTIAHFVVPSAFPLALSACRRGVLEIVSHGGDVRLLLALPHAARRMAVRALVRHAEVWRFPSESLQRDLVGSLHAREARALERIARVVAPPFEMPDISKKVEELRRRLAAEGDRARPLWVCAARLVPSKRVDRAIVHAATHGARLIVIGDGPEWARLASVARAQSADVSFLGRLPRPETLAWITVADALVHASEVEGLSTVVREAEMLGTRVVDPNDD